MADKLIERAFNKVLSQQKRADAKVEAERPLTETELRAQETERLRQDLTPMTAQDAIKRMILADKDKNYFRVLELPAPTVDALGRPVWTCSPSDISKAYRKLSSLVHPDKNPGEDSRAAFEALNKAHRLLRDPGSREEILNQHMENAKKRRAAEEAAATPDERVALYASKKSEALALRKQENADYRLEVLQQQQRLQERAKRKRELQEKAKRQEAERLEDGSEGEDSPKHEAYTKKVKSGLDRRKGKPKLIF